MPELEPVVVTGTIPSKISGTSTLDQTLLSRLPEGDGNVEDLVRYLPGVQISDESNTSFRGGEILPPLLSISGGRPYQNNFLIDGLGNNSLLDPVEDNPHLIDAVPGHPEEIFLNANLVREATIYDHNVPARYGHFTGGVVDVETVVPAGRFSGSVRLKSTRDSWTEFHIDPSDLQRFLDSGTHLQQPEFRKYSGGFELSLPISESTGLLLAYQFIHSKIPLVFLDTKRDQSRLNQNFFAKLVHDASDADRFSLQVIYNPYAGDYFTKDTLNSDFTIRGGGLSLTGNFLKRNDFGTFDLTVGIKRSENSRRAPKDFFTWTNSPSKNWGSLIGSSSSKEGGFGDVDLSQDTYQASLDFVSSEISSDASRHTVNAGIEWQRAYGRYDRDETSYAYRSSVLDPLTVCGLDMTACLPGEQYLSRRSVYGESHGRADINQYAIYLDDLIRIGRLELRPGVRVSYDDLMQNDDIAPRFAGTYDLFGNGESKLVGGWNRYFGKSLLTYKLRESIVLAEIETRSVVVDNDSEWVLSSQILAQDQFSQLKTPYVDEVVAGVDQLVWGGVAGFRYVQRDGEDEFARERDPFVAGEIRHARLNNNGRSHYESYRLAWERRWPHHQLSLNATYQDSTSTHGDYDDSLLAADLEEQIYFSGELLYRDELPRDDFNRHWTATLYYAVELPWSLLFTNVTHYRDGYKNIENSGVDVNIGGTFYDVYEEYNRPSAVLFDWRFDWTPSFDGDAPFTLTLEVFNVFDKKAHVGAAEDEYELGRQFWLGAEYRF